jgi:hypothetical protein
MGAYPVKGWGVMPKKMIYPDRHPDSPLPERRIEIGWHKPPHGSVQVGSTRKAAPGVGEHDVWLNESNSQPGVTWSTGTEFFVTGDPLPAWEGQHVELSRDEINQLIRALREARDQAYGRDE